MTSTSRYQDGQVCRLHTTSHGGVESSGEPEKIQVAGVIVGSKLHMEDPNRVLYYFYTTALEPSADLRRRRKTKLDAATLGTGVQRSRNELKVSATKLISREGYSYEFDGWYDDVFLEPVLIDGVPSLLPIQEAWLENMEKDHDPCEIRYLSYSMRPWFHSPFESLMYLSAPDNDRCYSLYLCHRCMSPFFSELQLSTHLAGYCSMSGPPGVLLYDDLNSGRKVWMIDGAEHLHFARSLSMVGRSFIESKMLNTDVDVYEFFVVTEPRRNLPSVGLTEAETLAFRQAAATYDLEKWSGDVVAAYFTRMKQRPNHALSCILTLPMFQGRHLATFMLDVAYQLVEERQRRCGCGAFCGRQGGYISRPFSPHGEALLLSYWREVCLTSWLRRDDQGLPNTFATLDELRSALAKPLSSDDVVFLFLNDDFCFYYTIDDRMKVEPGATKEAVVGSSAEATTATGRYSTHGWRSAVWTIGGTAEKSYHITLAFDRAEATRMGEKLRARGASSSLTQFNAACLTRRSNGSLCYDKSLWHY